MLNSSASYTVHFSLETGIATISQVPAGTYIVGIKYDPNTVIGTSVPSKPTNVYTFLAYLNGAPIISSPDSVSLAPKPTGKP